MPADGCVFDGAAGDARRISSFISRTSHRGVLPYYGYGRSDKKIGPRVPIAAKMVANLLTTAGADLHCDNGS